jgi:hypothetical protein
VSTERRHRYVAAVAIAMGVLGLTSVLLTIDLRARSEVRRTTHWLSSTDARLTQEQGHLLSTQQQTQLAASQVRALLGSISQTQTSLNASNASIASTGKGLYFGGFDISALNVCLIGVTQALDQVAVGQTGGALSSLKAVSMTCDAAKSGT